jgi:crotonobetainyl-CoA:carnitine CoA-transferase CaiB-like acyl-CoA transferase
VSSQLLAGLRILDLADGDADAVTRILSDLGADVLKVEAPDGGIARGARPTLAGVSIPFALHNANKRSAILDPADEGDRLRLLDLARDADIVVDSGVPGQATAYGTSCAELSDRFDHLVTLSVTDFGLADARSWWRATDAVLYALSGALSRSGPTTGPPVLPPDGIASATAAVQAAWAVLVAHYHRLRCGRGDYIDFSRFEAVVTTLDPAFGTQGQAALVRHSSERWRGRPKNQDPYPIFGCRDGFVRICLLSPRQWHGLRAWLGEPADFQDARYDGIAARYGAWPEICALVADLCEGRSMAELVATGQTHGVPIAAVLSVSEALRSGHFTEVGGLTDAELAPGVSATVPVGYFSVDGTHIGFRSPAPPLGRDTAEWIAPRTQPAAAPDRSPGGLPFTGLRIIDLGVIVAGGELSRLFGDLGAEVIKVESATFPDGLRQTRPDQPISDAFAWAHRNHLGFGLDLRHPRGAEVFAELVGRADAVFANFKPGTLAALGFPPARLRELNAGLVLAESSAFGDTGPWSPRMGYGPLVRATTGLTRLWTTQDAPDSGEAATDTGRHAFYDATTIFPDHVVARVTAIGALAALIHRDRTGAGSRIHVSQAEAVINQLDITYVAQAARDTYPGSVDEDTAVHAVYPCAGDDEWCVISLRSEADRAALAEVLDRPDLSADRGPLISAVSAWTARQAPQDVTARLQAAGIPAGRMNRAPDVYDDVQRGERKLFTDMAHPLIDHLLPTETGPARYRHIPPAALRPAPMPGEDTREICQKLLGYDTGETERLIAEGVLFAADAGRR